MTGIGDQVRELQVKVAKLETWLKVLALAAAANASPELGTAAKLVLQGMGQ